MKRQIPVILVGLFGVLFLVNIDHDLYAAFQE